MMRSTINKIVDYVIKIAEPEEIILFGSMANGTQNVYSDVDLLIITEELFADRQIADRVRQFAQELSLHADVLVQTKTSFQQACEIPDSFLSGIRYSGRILYKKGRKCLDF